MSPAAATRDPQHNAGRSIGPWTLGSSLGKGGNAEVYVAMNEQHGKVALKVLNCTSPKKEPWRRFRQEVAVLKSIGHKPGILPLIDAHLPENPSAKDKAWLAMPIATPICEALGPEAGLREVVGALAQIASTLSRLHEEGIAHRDIKPSNLYRYEGQYVLGDFGLVSLPDRKALTSEGGKLGPVFYIAPEMLNSAKSADGRPADIYSLAKTAYVLMTGQRYPPPGWHNLADNAMLISAMVADPRARFIDGLLERCTRNDPAKRPSSHDVANDLNAWLLPKDSSEKPDISSWGKRLAPHIDRRRSAAEMRRVEIEEARRVHSRFASILQSIAEQLGDAGIPVVGPEEQSKSLLNVYSSRTGKHSAPADEFFRPHSIRTQFVDRTMPILTSSVGLIYLGDGKADLAACHLVSPGISESDRGQGTVVWFECESAHLFSATLDQHRVALGSGLMANLRSALEEYERQLEVSGGRTSTDEQ
jgi:serine/threonine protein kinase